MHDALIDALRTFIAFRTVNANAEAKRQCLGWIRGAFLSNVDFPLEKGEIDGSSYLYLRHPNPSMLWFAHIDVVPGRDDQFALCVDGDRVLGRGVKDMKGATLAFLIAYSELCASGNIPPVSILLTSDEEVGGRTPRELVERGTFDGVPCAFTPDSGEHPYIVTELKGAMWVRLRCAGKSGHGAVPWESENPIPRLARILVMLVERFPSGAFADWHVTVTPTSVHGGEAVNRIPDEASCMLDVRFPSQQFATPDDAFRWFQSGLPDDCDADLIEGAHPMSIDPAYPMVQHMKRVAEDVLGTDVPIGREHGSSDARYFAAHGIPAFLYGPTGGDLHGEQEWVSLQSLERHVEINRKLLVELGSSRA